ncbi:MAG: Uma2 family endonuclease [Oscillospiraceae bacterium]|nr:Uma2 family endonuclease [Oscillospiraceae bacterium]
MSEAYDINYIDNPFIREMIDGKVYLMARPNNRHMVIQKNLNKLFENYFRRKNRKCAIFFEMELEIDVKNTMQPDLLVYCKENNEKKNKKIPLIVIEVLSDSTWKKDVTVKMKKYAEIGIEEYWVIDPRSQRISIYALENGEPGRYELRELYDLPPDDGFSGFRILREEEEKDAVREFSPVSFPEMTILLEDVFNFEDLEIIE